MFLDYYGLREQPFGVAPDPRYLYFSKTHQEALASLFYGLETSRGFLTLIAPPGMGKTTLIFHLLERLRGVAHTVFLFQTQCDSREIFRYLLSDLGIDAGDQNLACMHDKLNEVLLNDARAGKRFILVIDEAQNLDDSVLETVRLLSDFETPQSKLMQIVLAGQPQLADKLTRPGLAQLRQRISIVSRLRPFTPDETVMYINHRLSVAGTKDTLFTQGALGLIAVQSGGIPRTINNLCFNALSLGFARSQKKIDSMIVREALSDLDLDLLGTARDTGHQVSPIPFSVTQDLWKPEVVERQVRTAFRKNRSQRRSASANHVPAEGHVQTQPEDQGVGKLETMGETEVGTEPETACSEPVDTFFEHQPPATLAKEKESSNARGGHQAGRLYQALLKANSETGALENEAALQNPELNELGIAFRCLRILRSLGKETPPTAGDSEIQ